MTQLLDLPAPAIVNRAIHSLAVIVAGLFAFHAARLSGYAPATVAVAGLAALGAVASLGLRRTARIDGSPARLRRTLSLFSLPLRNWEIILAGAHCVRVRHDLPDLVVEVGTEDATVEILRYRNGFGRDEAEAAAVCARLAATLGVAGEGPG